MPVLGTGLITSRGDLWQKQRILLSSAFRIEILEETAVCTLASWLVYVSALFDHTLSFTKFVIDDPYYYFSVYRVAIG